MFLGLTSVWIIGIAVGVALSFVILKYDIQKYAIIFITAFAGTGVIVFTLLATFGDLSWLELMLNPVARVLEDSFLWFLFFVVVAAAGIFVQLRANRGYEVEEYNRWD